MVPPVAAAPSGISAAVPSTSFDQGVSNNAFMPYQPSPAPAGPNPYDAGQPSSSLDRIQSSQNDGMVGALNPTQGQPFGAGQTYVTVPVDKVMVSPGNLGQVETQMGTPANVAHSQPKPKAPATTPSTATPQRRYGGQAPQLSSPPYAPTIPAAQAGY